MEILFKPMKRTSCLLLFFVTGAVFLLLSCEKEKGIEKYAGWYSGWHQKYYYDDWNRDSLVSVSMQFPFDFHLIYDETTNCIVTEKQAHLAEYHLIVKDDGSFVSKELESHEVQMGAYERQPMVTGKFTKNQVEFRETRHPWAYKDYTQYYGEKK